MRQEDWMMRSGTESFVPHMMGIRIDDAYAPLMAFGMSKEEHDEQP